MPCAQQTLMMAVLPHRRCFLCQTAALRPRQAAAAWLAMGKDDETGAPQADFAGLHDPLGGRSVPAPGEGIQLPLAGSMQATRQQTNVQGWQASLTAVSCLQWWSPGPAMQARVAQPGLTLLICMTHWVLRGSTASS